MAPFRSARWICDPVFIGLAPRRVNRPQYAPAPADLPPHRADLRNHHLLVRRAFALASVPRRAELLITADDSYKLWVNGRFVGQGPAPGYPDHHYVNRWDLSGFLRAGANLIAVHVLYHGLFNRVWNSGDHRQGLAAELLADGAVALASDASWRGLRARHFTSDRTYGYDTQFIEDLDQRLLPAGWREHGFDDAGWAPLAEHPGDDHVFAEQPTPPLQITRAQPASLVEVAPGRWRADFGREVVGHVEVAASGLAGTVVEIRCGEELAADGTVRHELRCNCSYLDRWTLAGRGREIFEPFDYKAFRYAEIIAPPGVVDPAGLAAVVRHYPFDPAACSFSAQHPWLERIWAVCRDGVVMGAQESMVDCPTREKGQYLGDLTVSGHAHLLLTGDARLNAKALTDFARSTAICPGMMAVAPGGFNQEIADFSLQWPYQVLRHYRHTGDRAFLSAMLPAAEGILAHFARWRRGDGLLADVLGKWNLVDWPMNLRDGYDHPLSDPPQPGIHNVINAFFFLALQSVNGMRAELGRPAYEDPAAFRAAFQAAFLRPDGLFADTPTSAHCSLHANAVPLFAGLVPPASTAAVVDLIRRKRLACGVYMSYFVLRGLAAAGAHDLAWDLLTSEDEHSWVNMVREGASTCFEAWGREQKWNTSLCHPWASAPIPVLVEDLIGLSPAAPGWRRIAFRPRLPRWLPALSLRLTVPTGSVAVHWSAAGGEIQAPDGVPVERDG